MGGLAAQGGGRPLLLACGATSSAGSRLSGGAQTPKTRSCTTTSAPTCAPVLTHLPSPHATCSHVHTCTPHLHGARLALSTRADWGENRAPQHCPPHCHPQGGRAAVGCPSSRLRLSLRCAPPGPWRHTGCRPSTELVLLSCPRWMLDGHCLALVGPVSLEEAPAALPWAHPAHLAPLQVCQGLWTLLIPPPCHSQPHPLPAVLPCSWSMRLRSPTAVCQQPPTHTLTLLGRWRDGLQDELQLVEGGRAREQGPPLQHLPQNATQAPHVHPGSVPGEGRGVELEGGPQRLRHRWEEELRVRSGTLGARRPRALAGQGGAGAQTLQGEVGQDEGRSLAVTSWKTATPLEPGTILWPHTPSGHGPRAPQGGR